MQKNHFKKNNTGEDVNYHDMRKMKNSKQVAIEKGIIY